MSLTAVILAIIGALWFLHELGRVLDRSEQMRRQRDE